MSDYNTFGNISGNKKVILFPGQGVQFVGMGKDFCDNSSKTKQIWDCACDISGFDLRKLCLKGPMTRLTKTLYQQLAITTVNIAMYEDVMEHNELLSDDTVFVGHSAGEYSALYAAGVFDLENLFKAIYARASIMQQMAEITDGMMFVVKDIPYHQLQEFIISSHVGSNVKIANDNSPKQQVISGDSDIIKHFSIHLQQSGFPQIKLPVNGAWHSHLMKPAEPLLADAFQSITFNPPKQSIYMNYTAEETRQPEVIKKNLVHHLTNTVRWRETMEQLVNSNYANFIEIGSKKILTHILTNHNAVNDKAHIMHISDWLYKMKQVA